MPVSEDTEITLGTGKLLAVFFGLVAICAVFFGMGFSLGRAANRPAGLSAETQASTAEASVAPAAAEDWALTGIRGVGDIGVRRREHEGFVQPVDAAVNEHRNRIA